MVISWHLRTVTIATSRVWEYLVDGSCSSCGDMTISELHNRLHYVKYGRVPLPLLRSSIRSGIQGGAVSGGVRGDLRVTVRASQEEFLRQHWLHGRVLKWAWKHGTHRVQITPACPKPSDCGHIRRSFGQECPWNRCPGILWYLRITRPSVGEPRTQGHTVSGVWKSPQLHWHIHFLELLAVRLALRCLRGCIRGKDVLVCMDNTATIAHINRQGSLCCPSHVATRPRLLPLVSEASQLLRVIHIPGVFNWAADELS